MALVVENGTGLADANAYVDAPTFLAYCALHGYDVGNPETADVETWIAKGTMFVDNGREFKAGIAVNDQALEFPRTGLTDASGRTYEGVVPPKVKHATCEAAYMARGEKLFTDADRGGAIVSETVGPISTSYAATAPAQKLYGAVEALLAGFVRDAKTPRRPIPSFAPSCVTPAFTIGAMDNTGDDG
jgi:hypothetical protein